MVRLIQKKLKSVNILTISVRQDEGGAAYIAKTLHDGFSSEDINTKFLVGYGKKGFSERNEFNDIEYSNYVIPFSPHINFLVHSFIGKDILSPKKKQLVGLFKWSDVIICHILHSYFFNFSMFFKVLAENADQKKVIFVAHDSWFYTGRCAIIHECDNWKNGCLNCPHKEYYPRSLFSITNSQFNSKISLINNIPNLIFVSPTKWIHDNLKTIYPDIPVKIISNGIDTKPYQNNVRIKNENIEFCVSAANLSQKGKINYELINDLLDCGYKVHFIGHNNPFEKHPNAITHGYISNKVKYLKILKRAFIYLFTSSIDNYPTVLIDAICAGNYIFYTKSKGADEIMLTDEAWKGSCISCANDIINIIQNRDFHLYLSNIELQSVNREKALAFFDKKRMIKDYIDLITNDIVI